MSFVRTATLKTQRTTRTKPPTPGFNSRLKSFVDNYNLVVVSQVQNSWYTCMILYPRLSQSEKTNYKVNQNFKFPFYDYFSSFFVHSRGDRLSRVKFGISKSTLANANVN